MEDTAIIELYWAREERAIQETDAKYGPYCRSIAMGILHSHQDTEECVSDTWLPVPRWCCWRQRAERSPCWVWSAGCWMWAGAGLSRCFPLRPRLPKQLPGKPHLTNS